MKDPGASWKCMKESTLMTNHIAALIVTKNNLHPKGPGVSWKRMNESTLSTNHLKSAIVTTYQRLLREILLSV